MPNHALQIPVDLAGAYGVNVADIRFVTQVQNYIFGYERNGAEFILRLTPGTHQSAERVMAEVEWVNDLAAGEVPVVEVNKTLREFQRHFFKSVAVGSGQ